jgi:hypothetical protein
MRLYNALTEPNARDRPLLAKAKATAKKGDEALMMEPSKNLEQYREDERGVRAENDPKMRVSWREQLRGYGDGKIEEGKGKKK